MNEVFLIDDFIEDIMNIIAFLSGKKTYLLAVAGVVYALLGWYLGSVDSKTALEMIWASLTASAMRAGIDKVGK